MFENDESKECEIFEPIKIPEALVSLGPLSHLVERLPHVK